MRRKPLDQPVVQAVQRLQLFSVAFIEALRHKQLQAQGVPVDQKMHFPEERDRLVLAYCLKFAENFPAWFTGEDLTGFLLLCLCLIPQ